MGTASQTLAAFITDLRPADVPEPVRAAATRHLLDATGVALAAAHEGVVAPVADMARSWAGAAEAAVIGHDFRAPAANAALVNGALVHALDFDDTHVESVLHPSSVVVAAALAVGEEIGASGAQVLTAAVAGYEVGARVGAAAPGRLGVRGLDTTGVCGPFAAAAVAAYLWGLTPDETTAALGIAGSASGGVLAHLTEGDSTKQLQPGWAARAGIVAADLARRGATGPSTIFEGPHGVFDALLHGEEPDRDRLTHGLGSTWETCRIAIKPYPACDFLHALMDAASRATVRWADIEEVICSIPPAAVGIVAEPRAPRLHPATTGAAQYSLPFAVAAAIVGGREAMALFGPEARADRRILTLAERVHHEPDPTLPFPSAFGGRMRIHTRSGRTLHHDEEINRGHPDRPLTDAELDAKFLANATPRLGQDRARAALALLRGVSEVDQIDSLTAAVMTG